MPDSDDIAAAYRPNTAQPPLTGLPVHREESVAGWPVDDSRPAEQQEGATGGQTPDMGPVPIIGTISYGGLILQAAALAMAAGAVVTIGEKGNPRPLTTMIALYTTDGTLGAVVQLLGDQQEGTSTAGCFLPLGSFASGLLWLPLRRVTVKNASASPITLSYMICGYPMPTP